MAKRHKFKVWWITLLITIAGFGWAAYWFFFMIGNLGMDNLLDFFAMIAEIGVYGYYTIMGLIVGTIFLVVTIVLAVMKK